MYILLSGESTIEDAIETFTVTRAVKCPSAYYVFEKFVSENISARFLPESGRRTRKLLATEELEAS